MRLAVVTQMYYISIHAPRVGSDDKVSGTFGSPIVISIHAPRVGSDTSGYRLCADVTKFQSTLPVWGATTSFSASEAAVEISIHAPRVGSDSDFPDAYPWSDGISIHAPRVGSDLAIPW